MQGASREADGRAQDVAITLVSQVASPAPGLSQLSYPQVPSWSPICSSWSSPECPFSTWSWHWGSSTGRGLPASGRSAPS